MLRVPLLFLSILVMLSCQQKKTGAEARSDSAGVPQPNDVSPLDQSPMDMAWWPEAYPVKRMKGQDSTGPVARVIYSRPHRKNREIFGNDPKSLVLYGKPWRLGANESTEIHFFRNVNINGSNVAPGAYVLYCIPNRDSWTFALNTNLYSWGLGINEAADLMRVTVPIDSKQPPLEDFSIAFKENETGADLVVAWANVKAVLPIVYTK